MSIPEPDSVQALPADLLAALESAVPTFRKAFESIDNYDDKGRFIKNFLTASTTVLGPVDEEGEQKPVMDTTLVHFLKLYIKELADRYESLVEPKADITKHLQSPPPEVSSKASAGVDPGNADPMEIEDLGHADALEIEDPGHTNAMEIEDPGHTNAMEIEGPDSVSHGNTASAVPTGLQQSELKDKDTTDPNHVNTGDENKADDDDSHEEETGGDDLSIAPPLQVPTRESRLFNILRRKFANSHNLFRHENDSKTAQFGVLIETVKTCCLGELKWDAQNITRRQTSLLGFVSSLLSQKAFDDIIAVGHDVLEQQHREQFREQHSDDDEVLPAANRSFARALRHFESLVDSHQITDRTKNVLLNSAYVKLFISSREAIMELKKQVGKRKESKNARDWVSANLTKAGLKDQYSLIAEGKSLTQLRAIQIVQFYQRDRGRKFPENDFTAWSTKLDADLRQAQKIKEICEFEKGLYGLLPYQGRRLQDLVIEQEIDVVGSVGAKTTKISVNVIERILMSVQIKFPIKQMLRALWNGLLEKLVDKKDVHSGDYTSLQQLFADCSWQDIDESLYDGAEIGVVGSSGEFVA